MIHGAKDAYIGPEIARTLFNEAAEPKELWIVPEAKHNRCREMSPDAYAARLEWFFRQYAPRGLAGDSERAERHRPELPSGRSATRGTRLRRHAGLGRGRRHIGPCRRVALGRSGRLGRELTRTGRRAPQYALPALTVGSRSAERPSKSGRPGPSCDGGWLPASRKPAPNQFTFHFPTA